MRQASSGQNPLEAMAQSTPLPAPWHLVEPPNVLHIVIDAAALAALAGRQPNPLDFHKNMRQLLWLTMPPRNEKKWEVNGWMLLEDIGWITNDGEFFLPVVWKALDKFERWCKERTDRVDLKAFNGKAVAKLVHGTYKSNGIPSFKYQKVWRKVTPTPAYEQQIRSLESAVMTDALARIDELSPFEAAAARAAQTSAESDAASRAQLTLARETHERELASVQSASEQCIANTLSVHEQQLAANQLAAQEQLAAVQHSSQQALTVASDTLGVHKLAMEHLYDKPMRIVFIPYRTGILYSCYCLYSPQRVYSVVQPQIGTIGPYSVVQIRTIGLYSVVQIRTVGPESSWSVVCLASWARAAEPVVTELETEFCILYDRAA